MLLDIARVWDALLCLRVDLNPSQSVLAGYNSVPPPSTEWIPREFQNQRLLFFSVQWELVLESTTDAQIHEYSSPL